ncbi:MAG: hypothetical protein ACTSXG_00230 [Alphaproteobacteria bacterium]
MLLKIIFIIASSYILTSPAVHSSDKLLNDIKKYFSEAKGHEIIAILPSLYKKEPSFVNNETLKKVEAIALLVKGDYVRSLEKCNKLKETEETVFLRSLNEALLYKLSNFPETIFKDLSRLDIYPKKLKSCFLEKLFYVADAYDNHAAFKDLSDYARKFKTTNRLKAIVKFYEEKFNLMTLKDKDEKSKIEKKLNYFEKLDQSSALPSSFEQEIRFERIMQDYSSKKISRTHVIAALFSIYIKSKETPLGYRVAKKLLDVLEKEKNYKDAFLVSSELLINSSQYMKQKWIISRIQSLLKSFEERFDTLPPIRTMALYKQFHHLWLLNDQHDRLLDIKVLNKLIKIDLVNEAVDCLIKWAKNKEQLVYYTPIIFDLIQKQIDKKNYEKALNLIDYMDYPLMREDYGKRQYLRALALFKQGKQKEAINTIKNYRTPVSLLLLADIYATDQNWYEVIKILAPLEMTIKENQLPEAFDLDKMVLLLTLAYKETYQTNDVANMKEKYPDIIRKHSYLDYATSPNDAVPVRGRKELIELHIKEAEKLIESAKKSPNSS